MATTATVSILGRRWRATYSDSESRTLWLALASVAEGGEQERERGGDLGDDDAAGVWRIKALEDSGGRMD